MDILNTYFSDLVFFKAEYKEDFTLYAAAVVSAYGDGKKQYVLLFVPSHMAILDKAHIKDLHWSSLQTRVLNNGYKRLPAQRWNIPRGLQIPMFQIIDRDFNRSKYRCEEDPKIEMILLHDPKKKSKFQFTDRINLIASLTSFHCVLNVLETPSFPVGMTLQGPAGKSIEMSMGSSINPLNIPTRGKVPENIPISRTPIPSLAVKMPTPKMNDLYSGSSTYVAPEMIKKGCTTKYCMYESSFETAKEEVPEEVDGSFDLVN